MINNINDINEKFQNENLDIYISPNNLETAKSFLQKCGIDFNDELTHHALTNCYHQLKDILAPNVKLAQALKKCYEYVEINQFPWDALPKELQVNVLSEYYKEHGELPVQLSRVSKSNNHLFNSKILWETWYKQAFNYLDFQGDLNDIKLQYYFAKLYKKYSECKRPDQKNLLGYELIQEIFDLDPWPKWADFYYAVALQHVRENPIKSSHKSMKKSFNNNDHRAVLHCALSALLNHQNPSYYTISGQFHKITDINSIMLKLIELDNKGISKARRLIDLLLATKLITLDECKKNETVAAWLEAKMQHGKFIFQEMSKYSFADFRELNYAKLEDNINENSVYIETVDYLNYLAEHHQVKTELILSYHQGCQYLKENEYDKAEEIFLELSENNFIPAMIKLAHIYCIKYNNEENRNNPQLLLWLNSIKYYLKIAFKSDLRIKSNICSYAIIIDENDEGNKSKQTIDFLKEGLLQGSALAAQFFSESYRENSEDNNDALEPNYIPWLALAGNYIHLDDPSAKHAIYMYFENLAHIPSDIEGEFEFTHPTHSAIGAFASAIWHFHTNNLDIGMVDVAMCREEALLEEYLGIALGLDPDIVNVYRNLILRDEKLKEDVFLHEVINDLEKIISKRNIKGFRYQPPSKSSDQSKDENVLETVTDLKYVTMESIQSLDPLHFNHLDSENNSKQEYPIITEESEFPIITEESEFPIITEESEFPIITEESEFSFIEEESAFLILEEELASNNRISNIYELKSDNSLEQHQQEFGIQKLDSDVDDVDKCKNEVPNNQSLLNFSIFKDSNLEANKQSQSEDSNSSKKRRLE